ncbi:MAG: chromosome segregation protein SMC, partial [Betaproteobacteria bacterium]
WGQYAEISIKRVLTRDGDSSYYINNIPVRRRDIHDLFLGTGLGPRAYAIIEQGMISRVIEAKPEELRIFLEEAAGVSKYKERRKETEGRLADTRENLSRVEDIRLELGNQLTRLEGQAEVATQYRDLEARLKQSQHLLWYAKQQEAMRAKDRCTAEVAALQVAFEGVQAELRTAEARREALRAEHYTAGDILHERQGAFYAANAEVTRLEQQLGFARESETRIAQQVAQLTEALGAIAGEDTRLTGDRATAQATLEAAITQREAAKAEEQAAIDAVKPLEAQVAAVVTAINELQQGIALIEQGVRVVETRRDGATATLQRLAHRRGRLAQELVGIPAPVVDPVAELAEQLAQESQDLAGKQQALATLQQSVETLQVTQRTCADAWDRDSRRLGDLDARAQALSALQEKIGHGQDIDGWLATHGLTKAHRLWQVLDVEKGWEDALEAVLRERLNAIELAQLDAVAAWTGNAAPPRRVAAFAPATARHAPQSAHDTLLAKVHCNSDTVGRLVADGLHGVHCRPDLDSALAERAALAEGEHFVTPGGHLVSAHGVTFFAPDGDLHGVLARQRELTELTAALVGAREAAATARAQRDAVDIELRAAQQTSHAEGLAVGSQQRRVHDLELELLQLQQSVAAAQSRREQIAAETAEVNGLETQETQQRDGMTAEIANLQSKLHDEFARRDVQRAARNEAEVALARGRERVRSAERAAQEAGFAERSTHERIAELDRRRASLAEQDRQQRTQLAQLTTERAAIDWSPVEAALQLQLGQRGTAEQALAAARDEQEALGTALRTADEVRLAAEQKVEPARAKILEMQLKEQAADLAGIQFSEQLAEAQADVAVLPEALKTWGAARTLPAEIERLTSGIAELGAVNLAALDELTEARTRKDYLDAQAADLNEAMATLETAIRQIDRESREMLQQTFDTVNANFSRLFPVLFGGGQARLVLTGEEILDAGVQVVAQPPGKRNTSIHLLSGGEKALTAISLVFALFELNPAPFCLLDEVDAPLDDPNTERFCKMVQEMARDTQFLFISHNKITMEMANQLVGITMPEPGTS